jgi:hypothetical protein
MNMEEYFERLQKLAERHKNYPLDQVDTGQNGISKPHKPTKQ